MKMSQYDIPRNARRVRATRDRIDPDARKEARDVSCYNLPQWGRMERQPARWRARLCAGLPQLNLRLLHLVQKRVKLRQRQLHGHRFSRPGAVHDQLELQKYFADLRNFVIGRSHCKRTQLQ